MLTISRHTDYAARIVLHLALEGEGARVTARQVAAKRLIPPAFIRRIVSRLSAAGILITARGNGGGITLARPASRISLFEVVSAMEGSLALNGCTAEPESCPLSSGCTVRTAWEGATEALAKHLKKKPTSNPSPGAARGCAAGGPRPNASEARKGGTRWTRWCSRGCSSPSRPCSTTSTRPLPSAWRPSSSSSPPSG